MSSFTPLICTLFSHTLGFCSSSSMCNHENESKSHAVKPQLTAVCSHAGSGRSSKGKWPGCKSSTQSSSKLQRWPWLKFKFSVSQGFAEVDSSQASCTFPRISHETPRNRSSHLIQQLPTQNLCTERNACISQVSTFWPAAALF